MQKPIEWSHEKNEWLKAHRGICFEDVVEAIESQLLVVVDNPSKRYPHQKMYIVKIKNYVHAVPFIEDDEKVFLKTAYPSRKYTKKYQLLSK